MIQWEYFCTQGDTVGICLLVHRDSGWVLHVCLDITCNMEYVRKSWSQRVRKNPKRFILILRHVTKYTNVSQDLEFYLCQSHTVNGERTLERKHRCWGRVSVTVSTLGWFWSYNPRASNACVSLTTGTNVLRIQNPALLEKETHIHIFLLSS